MGIRPPSRYALRRDLIQTAESLDSKARANADAPTPFEKPPQERNPIEELDAMVGLDEVKAQVRRVIDLVSLQRRRREKGLPDLTFSHHLVFTGNPGTGKTTVARIVGRIYKEMGVLKKGHMVETDRGDLVGGFLGQTAEKTQKVLNKAMDGILFIDEAYALAPQSSHDPKGDMYGQEAVSTVLKSMEDNRERLAVIVAGYKDEMQHFVDSNPGLQSRFKTVIEFPDYDAGELRIIFTKMCADKACRLSFDAMAALARRMEVLKAGAGKGFGNGRDVRNIFEETIARQAERLRKNPNADITLIEAEDIPDVPDKPVPAAAAAAQEMPYGGYPPPKAKAAKPEPEPPPDFDVDAIINRIARESKPARKPAARAKARVAKKRSDS